MTVRLKALNGREAFAIDSEGKTTGKAEAKDDGRGGFSISLQGGSRVAFPPPR